MLSNQKLQNSLNEIKEISHMDTALFTAKGKLVAHTEEMPLPEALEQQVVVDFAESLAEKQTYQDYHLYKVMVEGETEYILVCLVKEESFLVCAQMAVCQIRNLVMSFAEQFDRNNFMQNILLGNMLVVDMYNKAQKLHIEQAERVVFVIEIDGNWYHADATWDDPVYDNLGRVMHNYFLISTDTVSYTHLTLPTT